MFVRFISSFLAALMLMLAPVAMAAGGQPMAHGATAAKQSDAPCHRSPDSGEKKQADRDAACANACAACPSIAPVVAAASDALPAAARGGTAILLTGIAPEREPPPPRSAPAI